MDDRLLLTIFRVSEFLDNYDEFRGFLIIFENILKQDFSRSLRIQNIPIIADFRSKFIKIQNLDIPRMEIPQKQT